MDLSVRERILILNLDTLPRVGSIVTMRIRKQLIDDVGFTEEELKDYSIRQEGEQILWSDDAPVRVIEIGEQAQKLLIVAMEKSETLTEDYLELYDRLKAQNEAD